MRTPEEREELYSKGKIRFPGLRGTWYRVDREVIQGVMFEAYESEVWGDEAAWVIATEDGQVVIPEAWNGLGDLHEWLDNGDVVIHHDGTVWVKPEEDIHVEVSECKE